ncbi:MAG: hypothetical protein IPH16_17035 [Haliscomenobacter sp.]|nr:hypothetical protein [Haliscomenobacter sp.]MBK7477498.1 hypothetical protein [Haliscomenobacter sp.]MBK8878987.1 hypothetical protein [Haliscomenobacter sp.]
MKTHLIRNLGGLLLLSSLYGGIHYPMGNEQGLSQGVSVGREVLKLRFE